MFAEGPGVGARSLATLGGLFSFLAGGSISDFVLAFESDRFLTRGRAGPKLGGCIFAVGATMKAGPKFGFSSTSDSDPSVFIRRRRSEDRTVTVEGMLLSILLLGVSKPQVAPAFSDRPRIGVSRVVPTALPPGMIPPRGLLPLFDVVVLP